MPIARTLIVVGSVLVALGLLALLAPRLPWLGRLPGDLVFGSGRARVYVPLATCLLISALVSAVLWLLRR